MIAGSIGTSLNRARHPAYMTTNLPERLPAQAKISSGIMFNVMITAWSSEAPFHQSNQCSLLLHVTIVRKRVLDKCGDSTPASASSSNHNVRRQLNNIRHNGELSVVGLPGDISA